jgi:hypothetical protein
VAYAIDRVWEVFGRYDITRLDPGAVGNDNLYNEVTVGANYYLGTGGSAGQRAKLTADAVYLPDGSPSNQTGLGIVQSTDAQFVLRVQFQLLL